ncbi:hypothetical protein LTR84_005923 [Exophiala bonariae]|uniref:Pinin/SDK/MemA protein domain-containing protein n=1 Tax=Exophiala bonariae TaxID=1690606 RepID=A0AAV9N583_9EURO|nr:hypothetical protein LTR84_005923 [Exophiala bonariae]
MISSAVIIPDEPEALSPTSNSTHDQSTSLKRRQSELSESPDPNKRPRIDAEGVTAPNPQNGVTSPSSSNTTRNATSPVAPFASEGAAMSPPRRRPTAKLDEKSRNRRLFGALLGNLAQPASRTKPSAKAGTTTTSPSTTSRREDIESRQRQRLQRESEEISQHARRKKEELNSKRRVEQRRWDEQGLRIKHANMRATAGFLRTKAEPRLYYKPWEMRGPEEDIVKRQKDDVEEAIKQDWEAWEVEKRRQEDAEREKEKADAMTKAGSTDDCTEDNHVQVTSRDTNGTTNDKKTSDHGQSQERPPSRSSNRAVSPVRSVSVGSKGPGSDRPQSSKGDDHGGEELELGQGQEDDVIY